MFGAFETWDQTLTARPGLRREGRRLHGASEPADLPNRGDDRNDCKSVVMSVRASAS
jgi:hypothetical protein